MEIYFTTIDYLDVESHQTLVTYNIDMQNKIE